MKLYVLTFEIGISSGCKQFLGIYDAEEKAEKMKEKHYLKHGYFKDYYNINEIELNQEVDITFAEW